MNRQRQKIKMDKKKRQQALDEISAEDLAKIKAHQAKTESPYPVDTEWLLQAEFAKAFGWQAYLDVKNDRIDSDEMMTLLEANRKLEALELHSSAQASFIGAVAAASKSPLKTFKALTINIIKNSKVDNK